MNEINQVKLLSKHQLEINLDQAGQRIDNFLINYLKGVPRSHIYRLLRHGEVRVNSGRVAAQYRIQVHDKIRIPPLRYSQTEKPASPGSRLVQLISTSIIHEDNGLIVINKPAGLAVHGGSGVNFGAIEIIRELRPKAACLELVHRLDRDTSGLLMIAKRRSVLRHLHTLLRDGSIEKYYLTLVKGNWQGQTRTINAPLIKNHLASGERIVRIDQTGKEAATIFMPLIKLSPASLIKARPITGRTHQIRVHANYAGYPIAGDEKYGHAEFNQLARNWGLNRLFLHAYYLSFENETGQKVTLTAQPDEILHNVLINLHKSCGKAMPHTSALTELLKPNAAITLKNA